MKDITILTTACGADFMPGFFNCLRNNHERNIRIIGVDTNDMPSQRLLIDKFYPVPCFTDSGYIKCLIDICLKEKIDILFPHISMELPIVLESVGEFKKNGILVAISDSGTLGIANNKLKLYDFMRENGLETPSYFRIKSISDMLGAAKLLGYPDKAVCLKVTESSGSRGVRILDAKKSKADLFFNCKPSSLYSSLDEMMEILSSCVELPEMMLMEYLPGNEYTVDLLAERGEVLYIAGRRNTVSLMSIAHESIVEKKEDAYDLCKKLVSLLQLDGNIGFDFMLDENDHTVLTDLNPRITASVVVFAAGGLNLPYLRVKQLLGEKLPSAEVNYGVMLSRRYLDLLTDADGRRLTI